MATASKSASDSPKVKEVVPIEPAIVSDLARPFGSVVALMILVALEEKDYSRNDLAENLGSTASNLTSPLGTLFEIGAIRRKSNKEDARSVYLGLTPTGKKFLKIAREIQALNEFQD
jgi:DNA-binding MarR family transcriptional regulator